MPKETRKRVTRYSIYRNIEERLLDSYKIVEDCWVWTKAIHPKTGYGITYYIKDSKKYNTTAHRVSYMTFKGDIPKGLVIDHLCRNRACINPEHLEAVTSQINNLRGIGVAAINIAKTHCANGHEYTPENTYIKKSNGARNCRICRNEASRKCLERKKYAIG